MRFLAVFVFFTQGLGIFALNVEAASIVTSKKSVHSTKGAKSSATQATATPEVSASPSENNTPSASASTSALSSNEKLAEKTGEKTEEKKAEANGVDLEEQKRLEKEEMRRCFNFQKKPSPLRTPPTSYKVDAEKAEPGTPDWAEVSGVVKKSVNELYQQLVNPRTIRGDESIGISLKNIPSENFLTLYEESIHVKPVFFLTLEWVETWGFALQEGTKTDPKKMLIAFEKTSGTSHIRRLCGNFQLKAASPNETEVYLYQEMDADRQDQKDILKNLKGTLRTLRETKEKPEA